jgi:4-hydroxy-3-methylbut-2-enyl diphosphate reductase
MQIEIIDTTCPSVKRVQLAAQRLMKAGFYVVIYGDAQHPEVKGILGWAQGQGQATMDIKTIASLDAIPRRLGVLSQTTQVPENFTRFVKDLINATLTRGVEIHIIDTICEGVRNRQSQTLALASRVDLMLVIGSLNSANTRRLLELSSPYTEAHLIGSADEINPDWIKGKNKVGITSGTSTSTENIDDVIKCLRTLAPK